jgi:hypothetical protein
LSRSCERKRREHRVDLEKEKGVNDILKQEVAITRRSGERKRSEKYGKNRRSKNNEDMEKIDVMSVEGINVS